MFQMLEQQKDGHFQWQTGGLPNGWFIEKIKLMIWGYPISGNLHILYYKNSHSFHGKAWDFRRGSRSRSHDERFAAWPQSTEVSGQNLRLRSAQLRCAMLPRNAGHCWAIWGIVALRLRFRRIKHSEDSIKGKSPKWMIYTEKSREHG